MAHKQDSKQIKMTPPGAIEDLERVYVTGLITVPTQLDNQDLWHEYWDELTIPIGNYGDRAYVWLRGLLFTGSVDDMWKQYWETP